MLYQKITAATELDIASVLDRIRPLHADILPSPTMAEAAARDVPAAVGWMIVGTYVTIMFLFIATFARSGEATMVTVISALYTAIYLAIPAIFLRVEATTGRTTYSAFLRRGLQTNTGHVGGGQAVLQILTIPVAIAIAVAGICLVVTLNR